jgi:hypothetical protein
MLAKESRYAPARDALCDAYGGRARALDQLGRCTEAAQAWEPAVRLDGGDWRAVLQLGRVISQANVSGDHRQALAKAESLAQNADGPTLAGLARLCARTSVPLADGQKPSAAAPFHEEYAARAVLLLRQAASKGFRDTLYLQKGTDLAPLRDRKDFQMLLADREAPIDRHSP